MTSQLIKEYLLAAKYHGNQPPEMVSAIITDPACSAVCHFLASPSGFDKNLKLAHCLLAQDVF